MNSFMFRRGLLAAGLSAPLIRPAQAQAREIQLAGATIEMREPILREFMRVSGARVRPWMNPSTQARMDRVRAAPVDVITTDAPFSQYGFGEQLTQPIDVSRLRSWSKLHPLFQEGRATPTAPLGLGANPGTMMWADAGKTKVTFSPAFFQMDSIGYNSRHIPAENNELSWGELFNPRWRGKVGLYAIDWLGMLDAALGMKALGLINPADPTNLTNAEVDTVTDFLKEKKKEGHFRAFWRTYGELVNLMTSEEVWIADAWWPVVLEVASKGIPMRYAVAKEGYRAWCNGHAISATCRNLDLAYEYLNFWLDGYAGAEQGKIGYYSTADTYKPHMAQDLQDSLYGGVGRDGGSFEERAARIYVWNTRPTNMGYYTEKWNEFLAA